MVGVLQYVRKLRASIYKDVSGIHIRDGLVDLLDVTFEFGPPGVARPVDNSWRLWLASETLFATAALDRSYSNPIHSRRMNKSRVQKCPF